MSSGGNSVESRVSVSKQIVKCRLAGTLTRSSDPASFHVKHSQQMRSHVSLDFNNYNQGSEMIAAF